VRRVQYCTCSAVHVVHSSPFNVKLYGIEVHVKMNDTVMEKLDTMVPYSVTVLKF
jgi:hypothetical protein